MSGALASIAAEAPRVASTSHLSRHFPNVTRFMNGRPERGSGTIVTGVCHASATHRVLKDGFECFEVGMDVGEDRSHGATNRTNREPGGSSRPVRRKKARDARRTAGSV